MGCGKGVVYLTSPGRPTDIGLQLGKACYIVAGEGRERMFLFLLFLHFIPVPLSPLPLSFISTMCSISFLPFSGRLHGLAKIKGSFCSFRCYTSISKL